MSKNSRMVAPKKAVAATPPAPALVYGLSNDFPKRIVFFEDNYYLEYYAQVTDADLVTPEGQINHPLYILILRYVAGAAETQQPGQGAAFFQRYGNVTIQNAFGLQAIAQQMGVNTHVEHATVMISRQLIIDVRTEIETTTNNVKSVYFGDTTTRTKGETVLLGEVLKNKHDDSIVAKVMVTRTPEGAFGIDAYVDDQAVAEVFLPEHCTTLCHLLVGPIPRENPLFNPDVSITDVINARLIQQTQEEQAAKDAQPIEGEVVETATETAVETVAETPAPAPAPVKKAPTRKRTPKAS